MQSGQRGESELIRAAAHASIIGGELTPKYLGLSSAVEVERLELAAQKFKVLRTDFSCEQLLNDGDEISQGVDRGQWRSIRRAAASTRAFSIVCRGIPRCWSCMASRRSGGRTCPLVPGVCW